jgi:hypothetical protein
MQRVAIRHRSALALSIALLACLAQLFLPVVHATMMAAPQGQMAGWCGEPSRAMAFAAQLPAEIREGLGLEGSSADPLDACADICATGAAPPVAAVAVTVLLRAAGLEPMAAVRPVPQTRDQAPPPPSRGPPAHA